MSSLPRLTKSFVPTLSHSETGQIRNITFADQISVPRQHRDENEPNRAATSRGILLAINKQSAKLMDGRIPEPSVSVLNGQPPDQNTRV